MLMCFKSLWEVKDPKSSPHLAIHIIVVPEILVLHHMLPHLGTVHPGDKILKCSESVDIINEENWGKLKNCQSVLYMRCFKKRTGVRVVHLGTR